MIGSVVKLYLRTSVIFRCGTEVGFVVWCPFLECRVAPLEPFKNRVFASLRAAIHAQILLRRITGKVIAIDSSLWTQMSLFAGVAGAIITMAPMQYSCFALMTRLSHKDCFA